jgi:exodeoxyribonuclease-3
MRIASWNVNSIRMRRERVLAFLERENVDVLCLQELKGTDRDFPAADFEAAGYRCVVHGQKTYNGVAILSRLEPQEVVTGLDDGVKDDHARLVGATFGGVRVFSAYVPNGQVVGSDKWDYKRDWLGRLRMHLDGRHDPSQLLALCGDFNVAPEARDVHDPALWEETVIFHPLARESLAGVTSWGLVDTFRLHDQSGGKYSWWDYRMLAFPKNLGVRIDFVFASRPLAQLCTSAWIARDERKGQQPSDHAPVLADFRL